MHYTKKHMGGKSIYMTSVYYILIHIITQKQQMCNVHIGTGIIGLNVFWL